MQINREDLNEKDVRRMKVSLIWSEPKGDCLIWKGLKGRAEPVKQGYIGKGDHRVSICRFIYAYYNGPIKEGYVVTHTCHEKMCVNPMHLIQVTQSDRMLNTYRKKNELGGIQYSGVLRPSDVKNIRLMQACYPHPNLALSLIEHYKVHRSTIYHILRGHTWKNITVTEEEKKAFLRKTEVKTTEPTD